MQTNTPKVSATLAKELAQAFASGALLTDLAQRVRLSPAEVTDAILDHVTARKALLKGMAQDYESGGTLTGLSKRTGLSIQHVRELLVEQGVTIRGKGRISRPKDEAPVDPRAQEMAALYQEGATLQEIGERFGVSRERVRQIFRRAGIESLGRREREIPLTQFEKRVAKLYEDGTRPSDIVARFKDKGLTYVSLQTILKRAKVETKPKGYFNRRPNYEKIRDGVIRDYEKGLDTEVIARKHNLCGPTEIYKFLKREGIEPRHPMPEIAHAE